MAAPITPPIRENRADRTQETRESASRIGSWVEPSTLPQPNPRPGIVFRYVRKSIMGESDPRNWSLRSREGWVPVKSEDYPELCLDAGLNESKSGIVEIGGLVLCAMSAEKKAARDEFLRHKNATQIQGVDAQLMREAGEDRRMPLFVERSSRVSRSSE